jgi:hypothetical protein
MDERKRHMADKWKTANGEVQYRCHSCNRAIACKVTFILAGFLGIGILRKGDCKALQMTTLTPDDGLRERYFD